MPILVFSPPVIGYDRFKEHYFGTKYTMRAPGLLSLSHLVTEVVGDIKTSKSIVGDLDRKAWLDKGEFRFCLYREKMHVSLFGTGYLFLFSMKMQKVCASFGKLLKKPSNPEV